MSLILFLKKPETLTSWYLPKKKTGLKTQFQANHCRESKSLDISFAGFAGKFMRFRSTNACRGESQSCEQEGSGDFFKSHIMHSTFMFVSSWCVKRQRIDKSTHKTNRFTKLYRHLKGGASFVSSCHPSSRLSKYFRRNWSCCCDSGALHARQTSKAMNNKEAQSCASAKNWPALRSSFCDPQN